VKLLSARPAREAGGFAPEFDHLALHVETDGRPWLADVGFGDLFLEPLRLQPGVEQQQGSRSFRIAALGDDLLLEMRDPGNDWKSQYRFSLRPRVMNDFAERSRFHQTSPESHFTRKALCSLATAEGRVTISGNKLVVTNGGERNERVLSNQSEIDELLREKFGVSLAR
jgi:N-hydroxyarylamine O-acetyltransferase